MLQTVLSYQMMLSAEQRIRDLAQQHDVGAQRLGIDDHADAISRLSDAEVPYDEIADLVVALQRHGIIDEPLAMELYGDYLSQISG